MVKQINIDELDRLFGMDNYHDDMSLVSYMVWYFDTQSMSKDSSCEERRRLDRQFLCGRAGTPAHIYDKCREHNISLDIAVELILEAAYNPLDENDIKWWLDHR